MNKIPYNLDETLQIAQSIFSATQAMTMAEQSDCHFDPDSGSFTVPFLGDRYLVSYPSGNVNRLDNGDASSLTIAILLLHYLSRATGTALSGEWISYKELKGGRVYIDPFTKRAVVPFVKSFGSRPEQFALAAAQFGGVKQSHGDLAYSIRALPRVPLLFILWKGSEEFPPNGTILFDRHANAYLHTEDYAILAGMIVSSMNKFINR
ncbi:MAG TPA: DUF3786 domain-containing protein [Candidatus Limnocylindrales bacterium]|nr:DUF3786 domain-containing protein [Candidatus Limnocylindrales bacterium]